VGPVVLGVILGPRDTTEGHLTERQGNFLSAEKHQWFRPHKDSIKLLKTQGLICFFHFHGLL